MDGLVYKACECEKVERAHHRRTGVVGAGAAASARVPIHSRRSEHGVGRYDDE